MNKVTKVIAGGLILGATAFVGCGDAEKVSELEAQLKAAEQRTLFVSDSLSLDCQGKLDALQAEMTKTAAAKAEPAAEKPTNSKTTKMSGSNAVDPSATDAKKSKISGSDAVAPEATDAKKSKMGTKP